MQGSPATPALCAEHAVRAGESESESPMEDPWLTSERSGWGPIGGWQSEPAGYRYGGEVEFVIPTDLLRKTWRELGAVLEECTALDESEGTSLPTEMQGPRLMQQLRERAGKIVQHLTV